MDLINELRILITALKESEIDFALCGGLAMAVYAFPRATLDIDILITKTDITRIKKCLEKYGYTIDSGLMEFKKGAIQIYRLGKVIQPGDEFLVLDLIFVTSEIETVWNTREILHWEFGDLPVVSPEGLIQMKRIRGSGQDQDDIAYLKGLKNED